LSAKELTPVASCEYFCRQTLHKKDSGIGRFMSIYVYNNCRFGVVWFSDIFTRDSCTGTVRQVLLSAY